MHYTVHRRRSPCLSLKLAAQNQLKWRWGSDRDATASSPPPWHFILPPESPRSQNSPSLDHRFWKILNINRYPPCAGVVLHGEPYMQIKISLQYYQAGYVSASHLTSTCTVFSCLVFLDILEMGSKLFSTKKPLFFDVDTVRSIKIKMTWGCGKSQILFKGIPLFLQTK